MDTKNIYIACQHNLARLISGEWMYIGDGAAFRQQQAAEMLTKHFGDVPLYLVISRREVVHASLTEAPALLAGFMLRGTSITVSNTDFSRMAFFDRIGVVKLGTCYVPEIKLPLQP